MTSLSERLRHASLSTHDHLPEDLMARVEREDVLRDLLVEAADRIDLLGKDAKYEAWQVVIEQFLAREVWLTDEDSNVSFEQYVSGGARVTLFSNLLSLLEDNGFRVVRTNDEA